MDVRKAQKSEYNSGKDSLSSFSLGAMFMKTNFESIWKLSTNEQTIPKRGVNEMRKYFKFGVCIR